MSEPHASGSPAFASPQFYVTPRQRFSPGSLLLALLVAFVGLAAVLHALSHSRHAGASTFGFGPSSGGVDSGSDADQDDDDPSRVDTIYLGGPHEAPTSTRPSAGRPSAVHPFVVVHLPRSGSQTGQIPDTPAGRLLYAWLAAFNGPDPSAVGKALPTPEPDAANAAQAELRKATGGFTLLSAREVRPGLLVFRLHDQTPAANEVLGTLQVDPDIRPAIIASFSLRAVPPPATPPPSAQTPQSTTIGPR